LRKPSDPHLRVKDDGLSDANNPSQLALEEISKIFPGRPIACFLSLGTGIPDVVRVKGNRSAIAVPAASCESVAMEVSEVFCQETREGHANPYFRFSVGRGLGRFKPYEWGKKALDLAGITAGYMRYRAQEEMVENCVKAMCRRLEAIELGLL